MTFRTNCKSIVNIVSEIRVFNPRFYVVRYQHATIRFACLTCVFISTDNVFAPSFIFAIVSSPLTLAFSFTIHIERMILSWLKIIIFFPLRVVCSAFYPVHPVLSFCWIVHHIQMYLFSYGFSVIRRIRTLDRTKFIFGTWRYSEIFSTMQALFYKWWIVTFLGAILSTSFLLTFGDKKREATSFACQFALAAFRKVFTFTFYRTTFSPAMFEDAGLDKENFTTIITSSFHALFGYMFSVFFTGARPAFAPTVTFFCSSAIFTLFRHFNTNRKTLFRLRRCCRCNTRKVEKGFVNYYRISWHKRQNALKGFVASTLIL